MNDDMEQKLKENLKTFIIVCIVYFFAILLIKFDLTSITKINEIKLSDIVTLVLPISFSSVLSFVCYFLVDFDIHNKIDKWFLRRKNVTKRYNEIIIDEAMKLNYYTKSLSTDDANFIFYYIANRQPELRGLAFNYWCKIYTFDLYIAVSIFFFLSLFVTIFLREGLCWLLLTSVPYLLFAFVCWKNCIPHVYNKAVLLPERQIKDFATSNTQEFCKLIMKMGFIKIQEKKIGYVTNEKCGYKTRKFGTKPKYSIQIFNMDCK